MLQQTFCIEAAGRCKDIIACGFDPAKTFIFRDSDYIRELYPVTLQIQKRVSMRQGGDGRDLNLGFEVAAAVSFPSLDGSSNLVMKILTCLDLIPKAGASAILVCRTAQNTFGFTLSDNIGKVAFAAVQASPAFAIAFPDFLEPGGQMGSREGF